MTELKEIKEGQKEFQASGKTYYVESRLSMQRYIEFEKLQNEVGWGLAFKDVYNKLTDAYEKLNKSKPMDAGVIIHNLLSGISSNLNGKLHPALYICTLFINEKDEDRKIWDRDIAERKIKDWLDEGIDAKSFFQFGASLVSDFTKIIEETSQNFSAPNPKTGKKEEKSTSAKD